MKTRTLLALGAAVSGLLLCPCPGNLLLAAAGGSRSTNHWSLQPLSRPSVPAVTNRWARNAIDHFVWQGLQRAGLSPSPEASRTVLIRRLSFDLLGLPPAPTEIDAFVNDRAPDAYARLVERYLASPRYGERWARHWLDAVRYTESQGFEYDHMRPNAWHFRDYVIQSFNQDKPYDQFVREQIAGDVLDPASPEGVIATSLLICGPWDQAGNSQANVAQKATTREEELEDLVSVVAQTFLGLTVNCARCHAHKFDPVSQEDYFRFKSVFEGVRHGERVVATPEQITRHEQRLAGLKRELAEQEKELQTLQVTARQAWLARPKRSPVILALAAGTILVSPAQLTATLTEEQQKAQARAMQQIERLRRDLSQVPALPVSYAGTRVQPDPTRRLRRGDVRNPLEVVAPGPLSALPLASGDFDLAPDAPEAKRRLKLANWITAADNPLTARVIANRVWLYHFGAGLAGTPNDLGAAGQKPTHPALLDWLAVELKENGWSLKALHRLIVNSAVYRQSGLHHAQASAVDADNQWLWRFPPRRLEAEAVRDAMLAISGQINLALGGPSFRPFSTKNFNATFYFPEDKIGSEFNRRTVYRMNVNSGKDPLLDAWDCPDPGSKVPRRPVTVTPLQALGLMNNSFVQRQAKAFADRLHQATGSNLTQSIDQAFRAALGRAPSASEAEDARETARVGGLATVCWALFNATEFVYVQ